jgi:hypothetical protein
VRSNLFQYLFGSSNAVDRSNNIGESVIQLFEQAAEVEDASLAANSQPLDTALKDLGIDTVLSKDESELSYPDETAYNKDASVIFNPDFMSNLAEKGWIPLRSDVQPCLCIKFISLIGPTDSPVKVADTCDIATPPDSDDAAAVNQFEHKTAVEISHIKLDEMTSVAGVPAVDSVMPVISSVPREKIKKKKSSKLV